jgi:hypothetical protein
MNIWIVAAADDAAFANIPKSLSRPVAPEILRKNGVTLEGKVHAWGARNGTNNVANILMRMKPGDLCLFYTRSPTGTDRSYHWAATLRGVKQSKELSADIWGTDAFELVYFLDPPWQVSASRSQVNQALGYGGDFFPRGLMRPDVSGNQLEAVANLVGAKGQGHEPPPTRPTEEPRTVPEIKVASADPVALTTYISHYCQAKGFWFPPSSMRRFYAAFRSKPFVILAGNSGTGKSRLVRLFAEATGATVENGRFTMIPVRPDWNDSAELLGYFDLNGDFIPGQLMPPLLMAHREPAKPFFVCLDEMNLARVEHYFSDFLSIIESRRREGANIITDPILRDAQLKRMKADGLRSEAQAALNHVRSENQPIGLPENLFIGGTVNMDETTQPFSRKVLDRAHTIEFNDIDLLQGLDEDVAAAEVPALDLDQSFFRPEYTSLNDVLPQHREKAKEIAGFIEDLNRNLSAAGFEVGYRVRDEAISFAVYASRAGLSAAEVNEAIVLQKILPRIQGSSPRVEKLLAALLVKLKGDADVPDPGDPNLDQRLTDLRMDDEASAVIRKIAGMLLLFREENFTSFWLA